MKEAEIEEAVETAKKIVKPEPGSWYTQIEQKLAHALLAVVNDEIEDDDSTPLDGDFAKRAASWAGATIVEEETPYVSAEEMKGIINMQKMLRNMNAPEPEPTPPADDTFWPPWVLAVTPTCKLDVGGYAQNYHLGMRLLTNDQKPGFLRDLWRRIAGTAWRVTNIRDGVVTVEQGR